MPSLSIIIPALDEETGLAVAIESLASFRARGAEVIVVDGGSKDRTPELARTLADRLVMSARGRATQMNAGAAAARGDILLFLHADTRLPDEADHLVLDGLTDSVWNWGRFDVRIEGRSWLLPIIAGLMNWRSAITGIATGDQAMFVTRETFEAVGGFPDIPLMEDIALSKRLNRVSRPLCIAARAITSGRRWDQHGALRTILLIWRLRLGYWLGAPPAVLARRYGYVPRDG